MPPFLPGLNGVTLSSEAERHEKKRGRRAVSEPTPMDVDGEEGRQFRCSFCNGNRPSRGPNSPIDTFYPKGIILRSHPDTSPIYFYDRGKPFFEYARIYNLMLAGSVILTYVVCSGLRTSLCTRLSMMERSTPPQNTVCGEVMPCNCNDDLSSSLSSLQVHDHRSSASRTYTNAT